MEKLSRPKTSPNNPNLMGLPAGGSVLFGEASRFAVLPIHTRFDEVAWAIHDAESGEGDVPECVGVVLTWDEVLAFAEKVGENS